MHSLLQLLGVLSALLAAAYSLQCKQCAGTTSCTGPSITCPAGSRCGYTHTKIIAAGNTQESFIRSCILEKQCDIKGSVSYPYSTIQMVSSCCSSDNCDAPTVPLPTIGTDKNGLVCRTCITASSDYCYTSDTMQCTGEQNMCLLQSTKISGGVSLQTAFRGCSTKSFCDIGSQTASEGGINTEAKFVCTSGSNGLHHGIFLPAFFSVVLLKVLS
ncbi:phospholipase A2 inhibitor and Ly6/PLAUR domain-containing protein-like [Discoglossus pictus]